MSTANAIMPELVLPPGEHNDLVTLIVNEFSPRFLNDTRVLFARDDSYIIVHQVGVLRSLGLSSEFRDQCMMA